MAALLFLIYTLALARSAASWDVVSLGPPSSELQLAAADAARYLRLLRCGHGPASAPPCAAPQPRATVYIGVSGALPPRLLSSPLNASTTLGAALRALAGDDAHLVAPVAGGVLCAGPTPRAALYAVYSLLEALGARFYLSGDILPPPNASLALPASPLLQAPAFAERGLNPFHDFPMGPDFWTLDFYRLVGTQMAKLKLNKWGYHTYPFGSAGPEPLAWVGVASQFDAATGAVLPGGGGAYESSWYLTQDFPRGNLPGSVSRATSQYCCGAAQPFAADCYGSPAQPACWPHNASASTAVLNAAAALLEGAFSWAARAGISSCLGAEMPLVPPPGSNASLRELYEGVFGRAAAATPSADCFWLWTTEAVEDHSSGHGYPQSNPLWAQLTAELAVALAARDAAAPRLRVGSSGWCLGPGDNSSYFDKVVDDPRFTLAAIDGSLGWCDVDAGFAQVTRHGATVIAWMEDDLGLAGAELWVERTLAHAADAARYGAQGYLGLLWRTWETAPQVAALAAAGWAAPGGAPLTAASVYADFCAAQFGAETAQVCAALFLSLDGVSAPVRTFTPEAARLPRGGQDCCGGPTSPDGSEGPIRVLATDAWEAWAATVSGAAAVERAARWVGLLQYHATVAEASLAGQALRAAAALVVDEDSARALGFPALAAMSWAWERMVTALLAIATTPGELGMLAAHEGMNWPSHFYSLAGPILPYMSSCAPAQASGCYWDNYTQPSGRVLPHVVSLSNPANSREWCGAACAALGYAWAGVEYGVACFCGATLPPPADALPAQRCAAMPCAGARGEGCGDADIISVFPAACAPAPGLPPGLLPSSAYLGAPRMWLTAPRTTVGAAEGGVAVEVAVLAADAPDEVQAVSWLPAGGGGNTTTPLRREGSGARGLWAATLPVPPGGAELEYVVVATWAAAARTLVAPVEGAVSVVFI